MPTTVAITVLPDDVLADVFRRVASSPRALALCRCVCRAWRALIDDRRLLRADLLPLSLAGLLLCLNIQWDNTDRIACPELIARPGAGAGGGYLLPRRATADIDDHCNGLVLMHDDVLNPATGRVVRLPKCPLSSLWEDSHYFVDERYLAFDPAESSPHYQVLCVPMVLVGLHVDKEESAAYRAVVQSEWPPSPLVLGVFSSATGRWAARSLVRRGGAAGTAGDMDVITIANKNPHAACWRGALYVHRQNDFVLRIPLSDHATTYQVIKPPREVEECRDMDEYRRLGKSKKGVYFAAFDREDHLCVWILHDDDSSIV